MREISEVTNRDLVKEEPKPPREKASRELTDREVVKEELKRSLEETRGDIAQTLSTIQKEVQKKLDWREWVRRYPEMSVFGTLLIGYWLGGKFISSSKPNLETENLFVKAIGTAVVTAVTNKAIEFLEDSLKQRS